MKSALWLAPVLFAAQVLVAQNAAPQAAATDSAPLAIVPLDSKTPEQGPKVTGALEVAQGKAMIVASGTITSGTETTQVTLPHRGVLRVCASTTVKLAADASIPAGETPGLLMAIDHGAVEASFAMGRNSDILLTPDFRILIGGPGAADVMVRLGEHGDTCVDNPGANAPYVVVTSDFQSGLYRVQPGQRVMFHHGSLHEVTDNEKEPCGCPPSTAKGNEFPLAQSEGLAPTPPPPAVTMGAGTEETQPVPPLVYKAGQAKGDQPAAALSVKPPEAAKKKQGFFAGLNRFLRRVFGAE